MAVVSLAPRQSSVESIDDLPHVDLGPQLNFTMWLLVALSAAFLALRMYCKFLRHRGTWWDDHVLIASWVWLLLPLQDHFVKNSS
jgi:hypothetical protein